jgi:alkylhydroperoxidase family enzyme
VPHWPAASCFTDVERLVLAYADCLVYDYGRVPDALYDALKAELGDAAMLELTYITALYLQHAVMSRALRTEFDDVDERIVEVAAPEGAEARDIGRDISLPAER